jgi:hypothetical protein
MTQKQLKTQLVDVLSERSERVNGHLSLTTETETKGRLNPYHLNGLLMTI